MPSTEEQLRQNLHKVAVLLTLIGREAAQSIIKHFNAQEIEHLGREMAKCKDVSKEEGELVMKEFVGALQNQNGLAHGGLEFVESVLAPAMEPERAQRMIRKIQSPRQIVPFEDLHDANPEALMEALKDEHPQTVALVAANLPADLSAKVLTLFSEALRNEIVRRVALLDRNVPDLEAIREIESRLVERLKHEEEKPEISKFGGTQTCADILNMLDKNLAHTILENMEKKSQDLATAVKVKMVRFEDIVKLTDMEIQRILKEVETQELALACAKAEKNVTEAVFRNMSQRGADMLKDDIDVMQNVKSDAIRGARQKIAETMRRLDEEGAIVLNKRSLDDESV